MPLRDKNLRQNVCDLTGKLPNVAGATTPSNSEILNTIRDPTLTSEYDATSIKLTPIGAIVRSPLRRNPSLPLFRGFRFISWRLPFEISVRMLLWSFARTVQIRFDTVSKGSLLATVS